MADAHYPAARDITMLYESCQGFHKSFYREFSPRPPLIPINPALKSQTPLQRGNDPRLFRPQAYRAAQNTVEAGILMPQ